MALQPWKARGFDPFVSAIGDPRTSPTRWPATRRQGSSGTTPRVPEIVGELAGGNQVRRDDSPERVLHQRVPVHRLVENPHLENGEWTAQESRWIDLPALLAAERSDRESHDFVGGSNVNASRGFSSMTGTTVQRGLHRSVR